MAAAAAAVSKTASTHRAALVHGTHVFDIVGYAALKTVGNAVTSGTFRVAGRDWNVVCRFDRQSLALISLKLADNQDPIVTATATFSIDDPTGTGTGTGGRKLMRIGSNENTVFSRHSPSYTVAVPEAFHRLEARYVKDDRLRIRCTVRVLEEEGSPTRYCFVAAPPPPDMTRFLKVLLEIGQRADVTFAVEASRRFDAHKLVLAMRSPVFRAKFFGGSRDSSLDWFRVYDVSAPVFRAMLHFIYTDELPPEDGGVGDGEDTAAASSMGMGMGMAQDLLVAADLYGLDRLRLMCERTLWERVRTDGGVGSAISMLALVNGRDNCRQLQDLCIGRVADDWEADWEAATATEEYRKLKTTCPTLLSNILESVLTKQLLRHGPTSAAMMPWENSSSVYRPSEVWRGTHQLTVLGHSVVRRTHSNGDSIRSDAFEVGGHEWRLLYYPSGCDDGNDWDAAVFLQLQVETMDPDVVLEASGTIVLGCRKGENATAEFRHRYTNDEPAAGCRKLFAAYLVGPDDSLRVECRFEFQVAAAAANNKMNKTTATTTTLEQDIVVPPPSISWHLERLLETGVGSDVTFSVEDGELHAHTLVLTQRAPALLSSKEAEAAAKGKQKKKKDKTATMTRMTIGVQGIKAVVFKALLHFVYTDELPPLDDLVRTAAGAGNQPEPSSWAISRTRLAGDLLAAAERYQLVERMRPLCENLLCEVITPENAAATLEVARRHGRPELRAFCLDYMTWPGVFKAVVASEGYQSLPADALRDIVTKLAH